MSNFMPRYEPFDAQPSVAIWVQL